MEHRLHSEINRLTAELSRVTAEAVRATRTSDKFEEQIERLELALAMSTHEECQRLQGRERELTEELQKLQAKEENLTIKCLEHELERLKSENERLCFGLAKDRVRMEQFEDNMRESQNAIQSVGAQNTQLAEHTAKLQAGIGVLKIVNVELEERCRNLQTENASLTANLERMGSERAGMEATLERMGSEKAGMEATITGLTGRLMLTESDNESLRTAAVESEQLRPEIQRLVTENNRLQALAGATEAARTEIDAVNEALREKLEEYKSEGHQLTTEIHTHQTNIGKLRVDIESLSTECTRLYAALAEHSSMTESLVGECERLQLDNDGLLRERREKKTEYAVLAEKSQQLLVEKEKLAQEVKRLSAENRAGYETQEQLRAEHESMKQQLSTAKAAGEMLGADIDRVKTDLNTKIELCKREIVMLEKIVEVKHEELVLETHDSQQLRSDIARLAKQLEEQRVEKKSLIQDCERISADNRKVANIALVGEAENRMLRAENQRLRAVNERLIMGLGKDMEINTPEIQRLTEESLRLQEALKAKKGKLESHLPLAVGTP